MGILSGVILLRLESRHFSPWGYLSGYFFPTPVKKSITRYQALAKRRATMHTTTCSTEFRMLNHHHLLDRTHPESRGLLILKCVFLSFHLTWASVIKVSKIKAFVGSAVYLTSSQIASLSHEA